MAGTQTEQAQIATLNGAVTLGTVITAAAGWVVNTSVATAINDGDVVVIVGRGGVEQEFAVAANAGGVTAIKPLESMTAAVTYPDKSPIYMKASKAVFP